MFEIFTLLDIVTGLSGDYCFSLFITSRSGADDAFFVDQPWPKDETGALNGFIISEIVALATMVIALYTSGIVFGDPSMGDGRLLRFV